MKGTIVSCLKEMVVEKFGKAAWEASLEKSGLPKNMVFLATEDVDDAAALTVVGNLCKELGVTLEQAADAFGEYWMTVYAPKIYKDYFRNCPTAKDFLLKMNDVHATVTKTIKNARPPKFEYNSKSPNVLSMTYKSDRNLVPFFQGLVKGVAKYYNQSVTTRMSSPNTMEITFLG